MSDERERWPWLAEDEGGQQREEARLAERESSECWLEENKDAVARLVHHPHVRNANGAAAFASATIGKNPDTVASVKLVTAECGKVRDGELGGVTDILTAQAMTLDAVFTEMLKRSGNNMGQYPEAAERYMRMAMKAQAQCRTTIEALGKIARGGEQVVKHIHIDNRGGQAVVTDTVSTGGANAQGAEQPHAIANAHIAALPGQDPFRHGVPIGGDEEWALQNARRLVTGCTSG